VSAFRTFLIPSLTPRAGAIPFEARSNLSLAPLILARSPAVAQVRACESVASAARAPLYFQVLWILARYAPKAAQVGTLSEAITIFEATPHAVVDAMPRPR
jgi:hypothetical protein